RFAHNVCSPRGGLACALVSSDLTRGRADRFPAIGTGRGVRSPHGGIERSARRRLSEERGLTSVMASGFRRYTGHRVRTTQGERCELIDTYRPRSLSAWWQRSPLVVVERRIHRDPAR